jgi:hypothetical protein
MREATAPNAHVLTAIFHALLYHPDGGAFHSGGGMIVQADGIVIESNSYYNLK